MVAVAGADADDPRQPHVPLAGLALVYATGLPLPEPRLPLERPETPARRFPADAGPAGVIIAGHARVDLTFERSACSAGQSAGSPSAWT